MRSYLTTHLVILIIAGIVAACGDKGKEVKITPLPLVVLVSDTSYFPNKVGHWWKYLVESDGDTFVVMVRISGDTVISGDSMNTWEYSIVDEGGEETFWYAEAVCTADDTVRFINFMNGNTSVFLLPFTTGKAWVNPQDATDSTLVLGLENVVQDTVPYDDAWHLFRKRQAWVYNYAYDYWFKPKVGMVQIRACSSWTGPVGSHEEHWYLIERHLWQ